MEKRIEMFDERISDEFFPQEMRIFIGEMEGYARTPRIRDGVGRRNEFPRRAIRIRDAPLRRGTRASAAFALRHDPICEEERKFGSDSGKTDSLSAHFIRCGDVVIFLERGALHPRAVVDTTDEKRGLIDDHVKARRLRIERIRQKLGEYHFFNRGS